MKANTNFERARTLTQKWPEWKRSYELTKDSVRGSVLTPATVVGGTDERQGSNRNTDRSRSK